MFGLNANEISVTVALIALGGVLISTVGTAARAGKSKYIDIIAAERIRWVDQLRKDFADFLDLLFRIQIASKRDRDEDVIEGQTAIAKLAGLIDLKLNFASSLDRAIVSTMRRCIRTQAVLGEKDQVEALGVDVVNLRILVRYLLKDEWDKARMEASGFINKLLINRKRKQRRRRIASEIKKLPKALVEFHE